jgi:hypothetical protein
MSYWSIITIFPSNIYTKFEQIDKNLNSECIHCQQPRNPREMPTEPRLRNTGLISKDILSGNCFQNHANRMNEREGKKSYNWIDLFRTQRLRKNTLLMIATW